MPVAFVHGYTGQITRASGSIPESKSNDSENVDIVEAKLKNPPRRR